MAAIATRVQYTNPRNAPTLRSKPQAEQTYAQSAGSPTESDFSDRWEDDDSILNWDEHRVGEWLRSINAGQYIQLFLENNITGENLIDLDQNVLKEMGVKKIGDRVRIGSQAKLVRHHEYRRKRDSNADSFAVLDQNPISAREFARSTKHAQNNRGDKRPDNNYANPALYSSPRNNSRPASPFYADQDGRIQRSQRYQALSPREIQQNEQSTSYFGLPQSQSSTALTGRETPLTGKFGPMSRIVETPQTARFPTSTVNGNAIVASDKTTIRVIYENAQSSIVNIEGFKNYEDLVVKALRKGMLKESLVRSYTFYVLDGTEARSAHCRRLSEAELVRVCNDRTRPERERLIFRKINSGDPDGPQLAAAAQIATQQAQQAQPNSSSNRSQLKIQKLTGESLPSLSYPMSPASAAERERHFNSAAQDLERPEDKLLPAPRPRPKRMKELQGGRPPSELVVNDPDTYFPDVQKGEIEKTVRMSIRRSQRLSRAQNRLSTVSNFSIASSLKDAPPVPALPALADSWWTGNNGPATPRTARPLSIVRQFRPMSSYRDSIASSMLEPLDEESSPTSEANRKSYVSFDGDAGQDSASLYVTDPEGKTISGYSDESNSYSTPPMSEHSLQRLSQAIDEDGEEADEELNEFLQDDSWDNVKYIRGKLIGQGSFGSVYLALHAITGELMAVKQVDLPSTEGTAIDAKKNNMVEALKREIALLRELKHPHIVQYLGSSSDTNNLNIFLEYIPGGSIAKMLEDFGSFTETLAANFVRQILVGLAYLHSRDIIHRDIKGANILVDNHGAVKISDFGISKRVQDSKTLLTDGATGPKPRGGMPGNRVSLQGSVFWMAPEVVRQTVVTHKADIWSLGCLIVEMLTGSHPHPTCTQLQALFKIGAKGTSAPDPSPEMPSTAGKDAREFLKKTFAMEHEMRPEAEELLQMAFVQVKS